MSASQNSEWSTFTPLSEIHGSRARALGWGAGRSLELQKGSKWIFPELPTLKHVKRDMAVLGAAAAALGEPIYIFGNDVKQCGSLRLSGLQASIRKSQAHNRM